MDELVLPTPYLTVGASHDTEAHPDKLRASRCKPPIRGIKCSETVTPKASDLSLHEEQRLHLVAVHSH
jgi:hypothetical protein